MVRRPACTRENLCLAAPVPRYPTCATNISDCDRIRRCTVGASGGTMSSSTDAAPVRPERERMVDQAYRQIRDAIVAVRLQPGAPLDEKALSASLGLGLTPIRDAVKRLTLEKLAVTYPRRGTYVSRINIADEARLTEIRVELEGLAAALAAERATESERAALLELLDALEHGGPERADHTELDARVHRAIYAAAH